MATRLLYSLHVFAAALCLTASMSGHAEETDPFGGKALKPGEQHDGKTLTVDELVACIDLQRDLKDKASQADSLEINADLAETRYRGLSQIIDAERRTLDTSDQHAIDAFNAKVEEQGAAVDTYNTVVVSLNEALADQDALAEQFNVKCTTSVYYASDLIKAYSIRERRLAASMAKDSAESGN